MLMVAAGAAGGVYLYLHRTLVQIQAHTRAVRLAQRTLAVALPGKPATALLIGYDQHEAGVGRSASDTLMLVRADPQRHTISLMSFSYDLLVTTAACRAHPPERTRINAAFAYCGPTGSVQTVEQLTGVPINYLVMVNYQGFRQLVDRLGGVYLDVDRRYYNRNVGSAATDYANIDLQPGYQRLDGRQALAYVRYRHTDSDLYRIVRQQLFVRALKQRVSGLWSITRLPSVLAALASNMEVAVGGGRPIGGSTLLNYAEFAYSLPPGHIVQAPIEGLTGYYYLSAPPGAVQAAVQTFLHPPVVGPVHRSAPARAPRPAAAAQPFRGTVEVLNGGGVPGAAGQLTRALQARGIHALDLGNMPSFAYATTEIRFDPATSGQHAAAAQLSQLLGGATIAPATSSGSSYLHIIVGKTIPTLLPQAPARTTTTTATTDPAATAATPVASDELAPLLRPLTKRLDFRLLSPRTKWAGSTLDQLEPLRAYRLGGRDALKIVYRTASTTGESKKRAGPPRPS